MIWIIKKTDKPFTFKTESADGSQFIIFKIDDPFNGKEIDVSSTNLSKDNVRFIRETLPTPEEDSAAIGTAYLYDENDQPVFAPNGKPLIIKKERWIYKEPQHSVLMVLHHGNPITTMGKLSCVFQDSENWTAAEQKKNRQELDSYALQDMHPRYPVTIPVIILIPLLGLIAFRKKAIS